MLGYSLPEDLDSEIGQLEELIKKYRRGEASQTELKAHRVPFGVYEQREPDTYMVRIRCAAGAVTPAQLEEVGNIALKYRLSDLHITSRQELQIHYVRLDDTISVMRDLEKIGLATRGGGGNTVRNIIAQEDAGIDPDEEFDVSPYAFALTSRLIRENDSWNLPRKYKIAFSGSSLDKACATIADLGFLAKMKDGRRGFRVYVAGGLGAKSAIGKLLFDFIEAENVYPVAEALKNVFSRFGNRRNKHAARIRFLWDSLGADEFKKRFHEEYEKIKQTGFKPLDIDEIKNKADLSVMAPEKPGDAGNFYLWKTRFTRPQKQKGLYSISVPVELGFISCDRAIKLARFLKAFGDDVVRMTRNQNFLLRNIPVTHLGNVYNFLRSAFDDIDQPPVYGGILSCAGASTCQLGICLSRQAARALIERLKVSALDLDKIGDIRMNISGCPNSCGQHLEGDIGFSGKVLRKDGRLYPAYNVFAGAVIHDGNTTFAKMVGEIAARDIPRLIEGLFKKYLSRADKSGGFRDYMMLEGKEHLRELCASFSDIPSFGEDKNYYFDWGADQPFSLAERRSGECSAGLFDLLEMDLNNIKKAESEIALSGTNTQARGKLIGELVLYATRMLLVTRGVEAKSEAETYEAFLKHFIETRLIDDSHRAVISLAKEKNYNTLLEKEPEVHQLVRAIRALYETMDNSFNFKTSTRVTDSQSSKEQGTLKDILPVAVKDFRGVACPLNFVKTKVELAKLKEGDILEIWLDDGPPIENVPGSVKAEGHRIIEQKKINNHWSVIIEKKKT